MKKGFTLIELIVAIAIISITAVMVIPMSRDLILDARLSSAGNEFILAINTARSEAAKKNQNVTMARIGSTWVDGYQIFSDFDSSQTINGNDTLILRSDKLESLTAGSLANITFTPLGIPTVISPWASPLNICDLRGKGRAVILSSIGSARIAKIESGCAI